ncbi:MAG: sulfatase-like hydrolase/transferase [Opitutaceae bacterium]|nr:sulfatase-like hydrolase/transferase [Opitutaceae bacterium]
MSIRTQLLIVVLAASFVATARECSAQTGGARRPNIVFVMTDDQATWSVGAYGNKQAVTPNIDRLAREGVLLRNAFVPSPVCSASRATFLTGLYGTEVGITDFLAGSEVAAGFGLPPETLTWPEVLQQQGYVTGLSGKWHLGTQPQFHPTNQGFDWFFGYMGAVNVPMNPPLEQDGTVRTFQGPISDILTDHAIGFIEKNREHPFALLLHFREPHLKYTPMPEVDQEAYRGREVAGAKFPGLDQQEVDQYTREYLVSVHAVDRNLGRLLKRLEELKLQDNTIVVFTSDHGYMIGQHGLHTKGNAWWMFPGIPHNTKRPNMFEETIRIPFIVRWPGHIPAGSQASEPFSSVDNFATVLGLMGVPVPSGSRQHGADFSPRLRGGEVTWRDAMFGQYDLISGGLAHMRMIRTSRWKLVRHYLSLELDELYDLQNDPGEQYNLYRPGRAGGRADGLDIPSVKQELQERLYAWQREIKDPLLLLMAQERDPAKR